MAICSIPDISLMIDLGVLDPRADEVTAFFVWGYVMDDPIVRARVWKWPRPNPVCIPLGTTNKVVEAMTENEKEELRERVIAKYTEFVKPAKVA